MKYSESPVIIFFRSMVLLAVLITLPGIAICWDHFSKDLWETPDQKSTTPKAEQTPPVHERTTEEKTTESVGSIARLVPQTIPAAEKPNDAPVPQIGGESPVARQVRDFHSLELRLKALGAKYYRLEKWGNRGELFRFSCFVSPSDRYKYEKYFQGIGADEVAVMESVMQDIEKWKNAASEGNTL